MDENSVSYKTLKNISYSFIGFAFPILFSVFITPIVVRRLGVVDYGVYVLVLTITGFLGLLDFGLNNAFIKYLAEASAKNDRGRMQEIIKTSNTIYLLIGIIGLIIFLILGSFFLSAFHIANMSRSHIFVVFAIAGVAFFLNSANSSYTNLPLALQRFDVMTKVNLGQLTFLNIGILIAVLLGYKLKIMMLLTLVAQVGLTAVYVVEAHKLFPEIRYRLGWSGEEVKSMYRFGILSSITTTAISSLNQLDRLIIPMFLGPAALSYYSLPGNVAQKTATVAGSLSAVFFPLASEVSSLGEYEKLAAMYRRIIRNITVLAAAIAASIMIFGYKILYYWIGKEVADSGSDILLILAVTYFITAVYGTLHNFLMGMGRMRFLATWSIVMAVLNVLLMVLLLPKFGIVGAAWAYLGGVSPMIWMFYRTEKHIMKLSSVGRFYIKLYAKVFGAAAVFAPIAYAIAHFWVKSFASLVVLGPMTTLLYLVIYWALGFTDTEDKGIFEHFFQQTVIRVKGIFSAFLRVR